MEGVGEGRGADRGGGERGHEDVNDAEGGGGGKIEARGWRGGWPLPGGALFFVHPTDTSRST